LQKHPARQKPEVRLWLVVLHLSKSIAIIFNRNR
jgi:hypothetical protein